MDKIVAVDNARCIRCGVCEGFAPKIFKQSATVFVEQAEAEKDWDRTQLCIYACPMDAISIQRGT